MAARIGKSLAPYLWSFGEWHRHVYHLKQNLAFLQGLFKDRNRDRDAFVATWRVVRGRSEDLRKAHFINGQAPLNKRAVIKEVDIQSGAIAKQFRNIYGLSIKKA